jgi:hypothetical protein
MRLAVAIALLVVVLVAGASYGMVEYFCPVCNSRSIEITSTDPPPEIALKSMDEMGNELLGVSVTYPIIRYHKYKARCLNCGHEVEFSKAY